MTTLNPSSTLPGLAVTTSNPLFPTPAPSTTSFSNLFPTGFTTGSNATSSSGSNGGGQNSPPSLYLIVFLSVLVLLLLTSAAVAIRAIFLRRRYRSSIERAIIRGEIPASRAEEIESRRRNGGWRDWWNGGLGEDDDDIRDMVLDLDGFDSPMGGSAGIMGMGGGGRRGRRGKRPPGDPPKLWEYQVETSEGSREKEGLVRASKNDEDPDSEEEGKEEVEMIKEKPPKSIPKSHWWEKNTGHPISVAIIKRQPKPPLFPSQATLPPLPNTYHSTQYYPNPANGASTTQPDYQASGTRPSDPTSSSASIFASSAGFTSSSNATAPSRSDLISRPKHPYSQSSPTTSWTPEGLNRLHSFDSSSPLALEPAPAPTSAPPSAARNGGTDVASSSAHPSNLVPPLTTEANTSAPPPAIEEGDVLQISYLITMPESDYQISRRRQQFRSQGECMEEEEEEGAHGPMEFGLCVSVISGEDEEEGQKGRKR